MSFRRLLF
jgi:hypothetical protein